MLVLKRDGHRESVKFDKITSRVEKLCYGLDLKFVSPVEVAMKVINGLYDGVTTIELDNLAAEIAATLTTKHPDYAKLAARIAVSNLHKVTSAWLTIAVIIPNITPCLCAFSMSSHVMLVSFKLKWAMNKKLPTKAIATPHATP